MKNIIITLLLLLQILPAFTRDLSFEIAGKYKRSVKKGTLEDSKLIRDIIPGYATNWIKEYVSVEMLAINNGTTKKVYGKDEKLTAEQKNLLNSADLFSHIVINVKYMDENAATGKIDLREMNVTLTIVPDFEAEFTGGKEKMKKYLKENAIDRIDDLTSEYILDCIISFTVNEAGEIINVQLMKSTEDPKTDSLLLDAINKMPKWKPALNSKGVKVKQDFEFKVGNGGC